MIDYVMPITKENLEALIDVGFSISVGCKKFLNGTEEGHQILFLSYISKSGTKVVNLQSDEGIPTKTITLQNAKDIMLLINLGLNTESIRESIKEIL